MYLRKDWYIFNSRRQSTNLCCIFYLRYPSSWLMAMESCWYWILQTNWRAGGWKGVYIPELIQVLWGWFLNGVGWAFYMKAFLIIFFYFQFCVFLATSINSYSIRIILLLLSLTALNFVFLPMWIWLALF